MPSPFTAQPLLPDLPNEEPWYELKFQFQELHGDCQQALSRLQALKPLLNVAAEAHHLHNELFRLYGAIHHDAQDHARRALELSEHLLTLAPEAVPSWEPGLGGDTDFAIPPAVSACTSLEEARSRLTLHLEEFRSALDQALNAVLSAAALRGSRIEVLKAVHAEAARVYEALDKVAVPHARDAYCWSEQHWRLADPQGASAHDRRVADIDAELAALEKG